MPHEQKRWKLTLSCGHTTTIDNPTKPGWQLEWCTPCGGDKFIDEIEEE